MQHAAIIRNAASSLYLDRPLTDGNTALNRGLWTLAEALRQHA